ncbi:MAG: hypothetical protein ACI9KS_000687, partial [Sulfitobacter sp.]
ETHMGETDAISSGFFDWCPGLVVKGKTDADQAAVHSAEHAILASAHRVA